MSRRTRLRILCERVTFNCLLVASPSFGSERSPCSSKAPALLFWERSAYYPPRCTRLRILSEGIALATENDAARHHRHHLARLAQHLAGTGGVGRGEQG